MLIVSCAASTVILQGTVAYDQKQTVSIEPKNKEHTETNRNRYIINTRTELEDVMEGERERDICRAIGGVEDVLAFTVLGTE
jgi:hypothetical protein